MINILVPFYPKGIIAQSRDVNYAIGPLGLVPGFAVSGKIFELYGIMQYFMTVYLIYREKSYFL
jgi:hypothetical protein